MINDQQRDLISAGAEGKLDELQRRQLDRIIAEDNQAKALYHKLSAVHETLGRIQSVTPPQEMKAQIMSHIKANPRNQTSRESVFAGIISRIIEPFVNPGRITVFAGGLAVGIIVFALMDMLPGIAPSDSINNLTGSMIFDNGSSTSQIASQEEWSLENATGSISIVSEGGQISLSVTIETEYEFEIEATFGVGPLGLVEWYCESPEMISVNNTSEITRFSGAGTTKFVAKYKSDGVTPSEAIVRVTVAGETKAVRLTIASRE
ncbi:MAG: hypothetical protein IIB00_05880 [candidate division Zixibacteria bacterium]|nr:hypothetical protein [candidate division Zixibacteria bacterium]